MTSPAAQSADRAADARREVIRIANFSGYAGDRFTALSEVVGGDPVDVLVGDYLAEITLAPLAAAFRKAPEKGYFDYFRIQLAPHLQGLLARGVRVVTNAGGYNPAALAAGLRADAQAQGLTVNVAYVEGDDVLPDLETLQSNGHELAHLETGSPLSSWGRSPLTANAYLGAWGIAAALTAGADIVVCGRVTDASLVVGPAAWWHSWEPDDWNALAGAVVAGHLIECGPQASGGNFAGFLDSPALTKPGFPIAEVAADGSSIITKHGRDEGTVTIDTVTAQLLYEIQGPRYLNPDVTVHLEDVQLREQGPDRVEVSGATGSPPPDTAKVAIFASAGYQTVHTVYVTAPEVEEKVALLRRQLESHRPVGVDHLEFTQIGVPDPHGLDQWSATVAIRVMATAKDRASLEQFGLDAVIASLYLSSFPGFFTDTATSARSSYRQLIDYWPALLAITELDHRVVLDDGTVLPVKGPPRTQPPHQLSPMEPVGRPDEGDLVEVRLQDLVHTRSGDKGGNSNVGVWVKDARYWPWLQSLSSQDLRRLLPETADLDVVRHELPHLLAVHFVIRGLLGTGGSSNLRVDQVGKAVGEYLRSRTVLIPRALLEV